MALSFDGTPSSRAVAITRFCSGTSPRADWWRRKGRQSTSPSACEISSPDNKRLISALPLWRGHSSRRGAVSILVWDLASRKPAVVTVEKVRARPHERSNPAAGSFVDKIVVCPSSPGSFSVYDAETGRETFSREVRDEMLHCAGFSLDSLVAGHVSRDKGIRVWDLAKRAAWSSSRPKPYGHCLVFSGTQ